MEAIWDGLRNEANQGSEGIGQTSERLGFTLGRVRPGQPVLNRQHTIRTLPECPSKQKPRVINPGLRALNHVDTDRLATPQLCSRQILINVNVYISVSAIQRAAESNCSG